MQKNQSQFQNLIRQLKERKMGEVNHCKDYHGNKRMKRESDPSDEDCLVDIPLRPSGSANNKSSPRPDQNEIKALSETADTQLTARIKSKTWSDEIRPIENEIVARKSSDESEIFPPLSSSTPKIKRLKYDSDSDVESSVNEPLIRNKKIAGKENNSMNNEINTNESSTTKRKSKLSLSRRYGAGSTKKTPCPVCGELVRESIINFHLDHCLGQQCNSKSDSSTVVTRAKNKQESNIASPKREVHADTKGHTSIELFKEDSEDELNFPLSQLPNQNSNTSSNTIKEPSLTRQPSQLSRISSTDTFKLLNITPEIIEASLDNDDMDFSELLDNNLEIPSITMQTNLIKPEKVSQQKNSFKRIKSANMQKVESSTSPVHESQGSGTTESICPEMKDENNICDIRQVSKRTTRASMAAMKKAAK